MAGTGRRGYKRWMKNRERETRGEEKEDAEGREGRDIKDG